jgi:hypothetical protein
MRQNCACARTNRPQYRTVQASDRAPNLVIGCAHRRLQHPAHSTQGIGISVTLRAASMQYHSDRRVSAPPRQWPPPAIDATEGALTTE